MDKVVCSPTYHGKAVETFVMRLYGGFCHFSMLMTSSGNTPTPNVLSTVSTLENDDMPQVTDGLSNRGDGDVATR